MDHLDDPEDFDALTELHRRAELAITKARSLCDESKAARRELREHLKTINRSIAQLGQREDMR